MYAFGKQIANTDTSDGFAVRYSPIVSFVSRRAMGAAVVAAAAAAAAALLSSAASGEQRAATPDGRSRVAPLRPTAAVVRAAFLLRRVEDLAHMMIGGGCREPRSLCHVLNLLLLFFLVPRINK